MRSCQRLSPLAISALALMAACSSSPSQDQDQGQHAPNDLGRDPDEGAFIIYPAPDAAPDDMSADMLIDMADMSTPDPCAQLSCGAHGRCVQGQCECPAWQTGSSCEQRCTIDWGSPNAQPIDGFRYSQNIPDVLWNDPSVLPDAQDQTAVTMWLSGGKVRQSAQDKHIRVYRATSPDAMTWTLKDSPVLSPGEPGQWDDHAIETPSVTRDGQGRYHLYYAGSSTQAALGVYSIGHATSNDGITWTKDPANPIITTASPGTSDWGVYTVSEPAVIYRPDLDELWVYYVSAGGSAEHQGQFALLLARSKDGSTFEHHQDPQGNREPVWSLTSSHPTQARYRGYSTPAITRGPGGLLHLAYDVVQAPEGNPDGFDQIAIGYATSEDGISFTQQHAQLAAREDHPWMNREVRAPAITFVKDTPMLWFAAGAPLIPAGPPEYIDWANHVEGFGLLLGQWRCEDAD